MIEKLAFSYDEYLAARSAADSVHKAAEELIGRLRIAQHRGVLMKITVTDANNGARHVFLSVGDLRFETELRYSAATLRGDPVIAEPVSTDKTSTDEIVSAVRTAMENGKLDAPLAKAVRRYNARSGG